ncbi:hypothetical protein M3Y99_01003500 [Aphelenchoides fujianensis]|nr:hypothetical protein M3Y99_01003500 [Aphelenchoides fujianensis]
MIAALLLGLFVFYLYYHLHHKRQKFPPGPMPLPIVGNLLEVMLNEPGEAAYAKWNKRYGGLFTFFLGDEPVVMVTDAKKMHEMFVKDADTYSARTVYSQRYGEYMKLARGGVGGVTFGDGESWKELRQFALQTFKHLGLGKNLMQEIIFLDLEETLQKIDAEIEGGRDVHDLPHRIDLTITSIICNLCYGTRVDDENLREFEELLRETNRAMSLFAHPANLFLQRNPHLFKRLPYFSGHLRASSEAITFVNSFLQRYIHAHEEKLSAIPPEDIVVTDFLAGFIKARATCAPEKRAFYSPAEFLSLISAAKEPPCLKRRMGLTVHIKDYECRLEKRH